MKSINKLLLASVACISFAAALPANAETIKTKTVISQKEVANVRKVNFSSFDLNEDNQLSMSEVGTKLFYIFDTDGNEVIDNIEINNKQVMTIIPMEKSTYTYIDWDNDGEVEETSFTHETFFDQSGLMRFDKNMDGLSASEFIGHSLLELDDDKSTVIELEEWKEAYEEATRPATAEQERYQQ